MDILAVGSNRLRLAFRSVNDGVERAILEQRTSRSLGEILHLAGSHSGVNVA